MSSTQSTQDGKQTSKSTSPMPSSDRTSNEDINSLVEHLRSIEGVDSDIAVKIAENWQRLLGVMAMILLGVWLYGSYQTRQVKKTEGVSNLFVEAQGAYRGLPQPDTEAGEENIKQISSGLAKIDSSVRLVTESYPESIYAELGPIYKALAQAKAGEPQKAVEALRPYQAAAKSDGKYSAAAGLSKKRFVDEFGAFVLAKILIEQTDGSKEGTELLTDLARNSAVVAPEAVITLIRIAKTDAEINEALKTARSVMDSRPELAAVIARELQAQGLESPLDSGTPVVLNPAQAG
ncbi:MAG: tetratricopeptide repeat protein [Bdellovibrionales bacterium]|nr:tetratricopeptide repeat protein [Bdellovibrionales bacterium]